MEELIDKQMEECQYKKLVLTSATIAKAQLFCTGTKLINKNAFTHLEKPQFCFLG